MSPDYRNLLYINENINYDLNDIFSIGLIILR